MNGTEIPAISKEGSKKWLSSRPGDASPRGDVCAVFQEILRSGSPPALSACQQTRCQGVELDARYSSAWEFPEICSCKEVPREQYLLLQVFILGHYLKRWRAELFLPRWQTFASNFSGWKLVHSASKKRVVSFL